MNPLAKSPKRNEGYNLRGKEDTVRCTEVFGWNKVLIALRTFIRGVIHDDYDMSS